MFHVDYFFQNFVCQFQLFGNKKVDTQVAQGARIRSVYIELDQERERNIHLRQQIANLRDELHQTRVEGKYEKCRGEHTGVFAPDRM